MKLAEVDPGEIVTLEGTVAAEVFELESEMSAPEPAAFPFNTTFAVEALPALTVEGVSVIEASEAGVTLRLACRETPL